MPLIDENRAHAFATGDRSAHHPGLPPGPAPWRGTMVQPTPVQTGARLGYHPEMSAERSR